MKRWIKASFVKYIRPKVEPTLHLFVEGADRLTNEQVKFIELRVDGPYTRPCGSKTEFCSYIEVNLLGNSSRDVSNVYDRENLQGLMMELLNADVCIYRTGNEGTEAGDDGTQVGVMQLIPSDAIKISDFGMIDSNTEVFQAVAEAHYEMYYTLG